MPKCKYKANISTGESCWNHPKTAISHIHFDMLLQSADMHNGDICRYMWKFLVGMPEVRKFSF